MIITLCGSARFEPFFKLWNEYLTLAGHVVYSLSVYPSDKAGEKSWYTEEEKYMLDVVHKRKIAASNAIIVLNAFGYIGESTKTEIEVAHILEKDVFYMERYLEGQECQPTPAFARYGLTEVVSPLDTKTDEISPTKLIENLSQHTLDRFIEARSKLYAP
jgi:hypothetical protein